MRRIPWFGGRRGCARQRTEPAADLARARRGAPPWFEGPAHVIDGLGGCTVVHATLDGVGPDGSWSGVLAGPLPWSRLHRELLILEVDSEVGLRSRFDVELVVDHQVAVHGEAHYVRAPMAMASTGRRVS